MFLHVFLIAGFFVAFLYVLIAFTLLRVQEALEVCMCMCVYVWVCMYV